MTKNIKVKNSVSTYLPMILPFGIPYRQVNRYTQKSYLENLKNLERWSKTWDVKLSKTKTVSSVFRNKLIGHIISLYTIVHLHRPSQVLGIIFE